MKKQGIYLKHNGITCSMGNGKLDKSILIFNIPSIKTCPNCKDCKARCYARKFEKLYPAVLVCRERNYQASLKVSFIEDMSAIISKGISHGTASVRVHESGDFYSIQYAHIWEAIADILILLIFTLKNYNIYIKGDLKHDKTRYIFKT